MRFGLDNDSHSFVKSPILTTSQNSLVKILDNTRSTFALFAAKVLLVEGDTDRYFFQSVFNILHPELKQTLAILYIAGKGNYERFKDFFTQYGLEVFFVGDFDNVFNSLGGSEIVSKSDRESYRVAIINQKLNNITPAQRAQLEQKFNLLKNDPNVISNPDYDKFQSLISCFKNISKVNYEELVARVSQQKPTLISEIENKYTDNIFILKRGAIEAYTGTQHSKIEEVIHFCETDLASWLTAGSVEAEEIKDIVNIISQA